MLNEKATQSFIAESRSVCLLQAATVLAPDTPPFRVTSARRVRSERLSGSWQRKARLPLANLALFRDKRHSSYYHCGGSKDDYHCERKIKWKRYDIYWKVQKSTFTKATIEPWLPLQDYRRYRPDVGHRYRTVQLYFSLGLHVDHTERTLWNQCFACFI